MFHLLYSMLFMSNRKSQFVTCRSGWVHRAQDHKHQRIAKICCLVTKARSSFGNKHLALEHGHNKLRMRSRDAYLDLGSWTFPLVLRCMGKEKRFAESIMRCKNCLCSRSCCRLWPTFSKLFRLAREIQWLEFGEHTQGISSTLC